MDTHNDDTTKNGKIHHKRAQYAKPAKVCEEFSESCAELCKSNIAVNKSSTALHLSHIKLHETLVTCRKNNPGNIAGLLECELASVECKQKIKILEEQIEETSKKLTGLSYFEKINQDMKKKIDQLKLYRKKTIVEFDKARFFQIKCEVFGDPESLKNEINFFKKLQSSLKIKNETLQGQVEQYYAEIHGDQHGKGLEAQLCEQENAADNFKSECDNLKKQIEEDGEFKKQIRGLQLELKKQAQYSNSPRSPKLSDSLSPANQQLYVRCAPHVCGAAMAGGIGYALSYLGGTEKSKKNKYLKLVHQSVEDARNLECVSVIAAGYGGRPHGFLNGKKGNETKALRNLTAEATKNVAGETLTALVLRLGLNKLTSTGRWKNISNYRIIKYVVKLPQPIKTLCQDFGRLCIIRKAWGLQKSNIPWL